MGLTASLSEIEALAIRLFLGDLSRADDDRRGWDDLNEEERREYQKLAREVLV